MVSPVNPYPLITAPLLKERPWGGRRLAAYGKSLPPGVPIGESWEVADLDEGVAGTPGGDRSLVANGALTGVSIHTITTTWRAGLLGPAHPAPTAFPLLIKLLDAREPLSVQVHPDARYAAEHRGVHEKTESWYVVAAEPGSVIYLGLAPGIGEAALLAACRSGEVEGVLRALPARVGDVHHVPAGTVHALGAGVLVAEVQTPSDTTFRLYDWARQLDRAPRPLHLDEARAAIDWDSRPEPPAIGAGGGSREILVTEAYRIVEHRLDDTEVAWPSEPICRILMVVDGRASVTAGGVDVELGLGTTAIVPASCAGESGVAGSGVVLEIVP